MIEWMAQAAPLRDDSTVKKMNDWSLLLSLNKITHYFSCSQKQQYLERTFRLKVVRMSSSLEKVAIPKVTLASDPLK